MIESTEKEILADDNSRIYYRKWEPSQKGQEKAVVQIIHGMAEHSLRYEEFAHYLAEHNMIVYAQDLRGHGKTAVSLNKLGFFAEHDGWEKVKHDILRLNQHIADNHPRTPVFALGHSMGSLLLRDILSDNFQNVSGIILSGTSYNPGFISKLGLLLAKAGIMLRGARKPSYVHNFLTFKSFNANFRPNRTRFDWLSRDTDKVDAYIADIYCGNVATFSFYKDLLAGITGLYKKDFHDSTVKNIPVFFITGSKDPVGDFGRGVKKVYNDYKKSGFKNCNIQIYTDARHEILNELNRETVYNDVRLWIERELQSKMND